MKPVIRKMKPVNYLGCCFEDLCQDCIKKIEILTKLGCGSEKPLRKTLCQLPKNHKGSCQAVIFWESE